MPDVIERIPSRSDVISSVRSRGGLIAAVMPIHYPRELLRAHGFHPVEVWGPPGVEPTIATPHFQSYTCPIVQNATAFLLRQGREVADLVLVPHACDALQGMASVLIDFVEERPPVSTLYLPRGRRASDVAFLSAELRRLGAELARLSGVAPSTSELLGAIELETSADHAFADLALARDAIALDDRAFYTLLRSREYLPPETFVELAEAAPRGDLVGAGLPLMLSGIVPEPMSLFDAIAEAGGRVVADDLACCSRRIYRAGQAADPWERMAERLLSAPPDPTRGTPIPERAAHLVDRMRDTGARGLLVYDVTFCEPELFDLPLLRRATGEAGHAFLHVEVDLSKTLSNQSTTRIQAFVEMLA